MSEYSVNHMDVYLVCNKNKIENAIFIPKLPAKLISLSYGNFFQKEYIFPRVKGLYVH